MKPRLSALALIAALTVAVTAQSAPPGTILHDREKLATLEKYADKPEELAKNVAEFDAQKTAQLGEGWRELLANADRHEETDKLVDVYTGGRSFPKATWRWAGTAAKNKMIAYLAAKPSLDENDLMAVKDLCNPGSHHPAIVARMADFLALESEASEDYYRLKYNHILGMGGGYDGWKAYMLPEEWLALSAGAYQPATFKDMREGLLAMIMNTVIEKRKAAGEPVQGPAFNNAMEPFIAALNAPLFAGLQDAAAGLDINLPAQDYATTVASAATTVSEIERHAIPEKEATKKLGTVMFVKGVAAYNEWKDTFVVTP